MNHILVVDDEAYNLDLLEDIFGDDYEVLAAVPPVAAGAFELAAAKAGVPVTFIGLASAVDAPPRFLGRDGTDASFRRGSFSHF